jgi:hypothetical protein
MRSIALLILAGCAASTRPPTPPATPPAAPQAAAPTTPPTVDPAGLATSPDEVCAAALAKAWDGGRDPNSEIEPPTCFSEAVASTVPPWQIATYCIRLAHHPAEGRGAFRCGVAVGLGAAWWGRIVDEYNTNDLPRETEHGFDVTKVEAVARPGAARRSTEPLLVVHFGVTPPELNDVGGFTICRTRPTPACSKPLGLSMTTWHLDTGDDGELQVVVEDASGLTAYPVEFGPDAE